MLSFEEALDDIQTPTVVEDEAAPVERVDIEPTGSSDARESTNAAARMLELAAVTADRLVTDAEKEADSLVTSARAAADAILESSRAEAHQVAAQLARSKEELTAELRQERATRLAGLADERVTLEAGIARLQQIQSDYRNKMRSHLAEQLSLLEAIAPGAPAAVAG